MEEKNNLNMPDTVADSDVSGKPVKMASIASERRKETIFYIAMVALPMLQFAIYYVVINFNSLLMAFQVWDPTLSKFVFKDVFVNFRNVFDQLGWEGGNLRGAVGTSIKIYLLGWLIKPFNLLFPFYVYKKMPAAGFFKIMLFLPQVLSGMVMGLLYKNLLDSALPQLLEFEYGIIMTSVFDDPNSLFWAIWIYGIIDGIGGSILIYLAAMMRIPETLVEYAKLEGCTALQEFAKITFPLILPTFATYLVLGFTGIFTNSFHLFTFFGTNPKGVETVGYHVFRLVRAQLASGGNDIYPFASAIGMFFTLILTPLTIIFRKIINKATPAVQY